MSLSGQVALWVIEEPGVENPPTNLALHSYTVGWTVKKTNDLIDTAEPEISEYNYTYSFFFFFFFNMAPTLPTMQLSN